MGKINADKLTKLFCAIISSNQEIEDKTLNILSEKFGKIDIKSSRMPFDYTAYYNEEMGENLMRFWISFEDLVFAGDLSDIKVFANSIEDSFAVNDKRTINIDPGYITQANVVLATTKNYSHRIYLSKGIYGEVTTIYKKREGFIKLPWTYPDYSTPVAKDFLLKSREKFLVQLKAV
jgi:hypothetical protein